MVLTMLRTRELNGAELNWAEQNGAEQNCERCAAEVSWAQTWCCCCCCCGNRIWPKVTVRATTATTDWNCLSTVYLAGLFKQIAVKCWGSEPVLIVCNDNANGKASWDWRYSDSVCLSRLNGKQTHQLHLPLSLPPSLSYSLVGEKDFVCNNNEASLQSSVSANWHFNHASIWHVFMMQITRQAKPVEYDELDTARGMHPSHIACSSCNAKAPHPLPSPSTSPSPPFRFLMKMKFLLVGYVFVTFRGLL